MPTSYEIPDQYLPSVIHYLNGFRNDTEDLSKPYLNPYFAKIYLFFVIIYALLIVSSILANFAMTYHIFKYDMHKDPTCAFLINIAIANALHVAFALPITLSVILLQNWIFGQFICFCLPMMQDIPIHVSMMTYLLIATDRYRLLSDPRKPRIPACVCALGTWFFAICIVLPYPVYITFLDLQSFRNMEYNKYSARGLQMCMVNLADDIQEYIRGLFVGTYITPLAVTAYLYVKSSNELENQEEPLAVAVFEAQAKESTSFSRQGSNASNDIAITIHGKRRSESVGTNACSNLSTSYDLDDIELDVIKEKRTQKYLIFMVTAYAICLCPLMILRLARLAVTETYENTHHFGMTYVIFVWVAFLPALITPCLYASWQMSRLAKERLRGYFRFSNRHTRVCEESQRLPRERTRHLKTIGSISVGTPRSRAGSTNSGNGSVSAISINIPRSPKSSATVLPDSPDLYIARLGSSSRNESRHEHVPVASTSIIRGKDIGVGTDVWRDWSGSSRCSRKFFDERIDIQHRDIEE